MAADSDNEMRDFTDSEGEQERWEERRVQGLVSGLSKCRPFYAPNIFAGIPFQHPIAGHRRLQPAMASPVKSDYPCIIWLC